MALPNPTGPKNMPFLPFSGRPAVCHSIRTSRFLHAMTRAVDLPDPDLPQVAESTVVGLFKSQAKRVRSFLRWRLRSDEDAQDAAQEGLLRLWRCGNEGAARDQERSIRMTPAHTVPVECVPFR